MPGQARRALDVAGAALLTVAVSSFTLGLVKANDWGWGSPGTLSCLAAAVVLLALFVVRCRRHPDPLISPSLFSERSFSGASAAMALFSIGFGAMLLSVVLWCQDIWGWSALRTGLAIAPGPLLVPIFSIVAGRLIPRLGAGAVVAAGCAAFAGGLAWWALAADAQPHYVSTLLGGMLLTGVGVGLTLPTLMAAASASLPADAFATGSGVVTMVRQVGLAIGVAIFVAVVGSPRGASAARTAFTNGWWVLASVSALAAAVGAIGLRSPRTAATPARAPTGAQA